MLEGRCDTDTQVSGKDTHARTHARTHSHMHLFLTLFMWQAKAPAGEIHSTLYSLRTCDGGGKERRKREGVGREGEARKRHRWKHLSSGMCG